MKDTSPRGYRFQSKEDLKKQVVIRLDECTYQWMCESKDVKSLSSYIRGLILKDKEK